MVPLVSGGVHGRTSTRAPVQQNPCMDARVPVHTRSPDPSYKKSYLLSYSTSPCTSASFNGMGMDTGEIVREREAQTSALIRRQQERSERFLRGPIPVSAIAAAGVLPGRALLVLLTIRHRIDITGKPTVSLPAAVMREFGFDRFAKSRALVELEGAGLIRVQRVAGRAVLVSLASKRTEGGKNASGSVP